MKIHDETKASTRAERIDPVLSAAGWGQNGSKTNQVVLLQKMNSLLEIGSKFANAVCDQFHDLDDFRQSLLQKAFAGEST